MTWASLNGEFSKTHTEKNIKVEHCVAPFITNRREPLLYYDDDDSLWRHQFVENVTKRKKRNERERRAITENGCWVLIELSAHKHSVCRSLVIFSNNFFLLYLSFVWMKINLICDRVNIVIKRSNFAVLKIRFLDTKAKSKQIKFKVCELEETKSFGQVKQKFSYLPLIVGIKFYCRVFNENREIRRKVHMKRQKPKRFRYDQCLEKWDGRITRTSFSSRGLLVMCFVVVARGRRRNA